MRYLLISVLGNYKMKAFIVSGSQQVTCNSLTQYSGLWFLNFWLWPQVIFPCHGEKWQQCRELLSLSCLQLLHSPQLVFSMNKQKNSLCFWDFLITVCRINGLFLQRGKSNPFAHHCNYFLEYTTWQFLFRRVFMLTMWIQMFLLMTFPYSGPKVSCPFFRKISQWTVLKLHC